MFLDLDDTIFDHSLTCRDALARVRSRYRVLRGKPMDAVWREYARLLDDTHGSVMAGRRTPEDARVERFRRLGDWAGDPIPLAAAREVAEAYHRYYTKFRREVPGATAAVRRLKQHSRIGIVTNNTVAEQSEKLAFLGLDRAVDLLVTSEEVGSAKPDPRIFRAALVRADTAAADAVMIGDRWESDVVGALAAGIRPVWFNRFGLTRPGATAVPEFRSFRAVRQLVRLVARA